jgi:hypothetical protein
VRYHLWLDHDIRQSIGSAIPAREPAGMPNTTSLRQFAFVTGATLDVSLRGHLKNIAIPDGGANQEPYLSRELASRLLAISPTS